MEVAVIVLLSLKLAASVALIILTIFGIIELRAIHQWTEAEARMVIQNLKMQEMYAAQAQAEVEFEYDN